MPMLPMVGEEFAGYRLRGVIGRGGMSVVFQAENPRLGSIVALKVLAPELAANDIFRARFLQESRVAASLHHPNVIPIYDMGPCGDLLYIAMRFVAGTDLRALLKAEGQLFPGQALFITEQAARALDAAHRKGLVHRDVKPGNILIEHGSDNDPDHVYLADFGITKHAMSRSGLTSTGEFLGTIDYVAPEQIRGMPVDGRSDQYSLGCVLYECLTGRVPFAKELDAAVIWAHVEELPPMPSTLRSELPGSIDEVFGRVLAKKASDRYPSCREFVNAARGALEAPRTGHAAEPQTVFARQSPPDYHQSGDSPPGELQQPGDTNKTGGLGEPGSDGPRHTPAPQRRRHGNRRWLAAAGVLVLLIAGGAAGWLASRGDRSGSPSRPGARSSAPATRSASPLQRALALANSVESPPYSSKGMLPPKTCRGRGASMVTCKNPVPFISTASFRVFPSLNALYDAYVTMVRSFGQGQFRANSGNCNVGHTNGEVSWNHGFQHPRTYSLQQLRSGKLSDNQAAGRIFCTITGGQLTLVWTQNEGKLLAWLAGGPHEAAYQWWVRVHHNIDIKGSSTPMKM